MDEATSHNEEHTERRRQDGTSDKHRQATSDNLLGHAGKANEKEREVHASSRTLEQGATETQMDRFLRLIA